MSFTLVWQTLLIFAVGTLLLRISGRKSISQMTIPQTIIMIAIGSLLIQPVTGNGLWPTFGVALLLILSLLVTEYLQVKLDKAETVITGKAVMVIENGTLLEKNLKKLRLTVDKLEERLRKAGISSIQDVQYATIESNGQLGYTLKKGKQPATKEDIQTLIELIQNGKLTYPDPHRSADDDIFFETIRRPDPPDPEHLQ
ncbi:DUF421 domain-containing protein [Bacillus piscicola]|uniref:DUF421 domain-containing protein n=1 Tax=Bacillus piscicola TaxID=1632684 RepID=UPI001F08DF2B|nr:DUF421 domain-containing protein [Bacillus piscicola]